MARIQQSIEIGVPAHVLYNQLTQFEDYPRFMEEVEAVQQVDDTHLHWTTRMANRPVEWDAEITEQQPDRCIAWHNTSGPSNSGMVEVQPVSEDASRVIFTLQAEPEQLPGSMAGNHEEEMAERLKMDLARLKDLVEARGSETGSWRGEVHDAQVTMRDRDAKAQSGAGASQAASQEAPRSAPVQTSNYGAGSEGWDGTEDATEPVISANQTAAQSGKTSNMDESAVSQPQASASGATPDAMASDSTTQSDYSLSKPLEGEAEGGQFSVAEEVSFDMQSDDARRVGQMPPDVGAPAMNPSEGMAASLKQEGQQGQEDQVGQNPQGQQQASNEKNLKQSIERAVPPSD